MTEPHPSFQVNMDAYKEMGKQYVLLYEKWVQECTYFYTRVDVGKYELKKLDWSYIETSY